MHPSFVLKYFPPATFPHTRGKLENPRLHCLLARRRCVAALATGKLAWRPLKNQEGHSRVFVVDWTVAAAAAVVACVSQGGQRHQQQRHHWRPPLDISIYVGLPPNCPGVPKPQVSERTLQESHRRHIGVWSWRCISSRQSVGETKTLAQTDGRSGMWDTLWA